MKMRSENNSRLDNSSKMTQSTAMNIITEENRGSKAQMFLTQAEKQRESRIQKKKEQ